MDTTILRQHLVFICKNSRSQINAFILINHQPNKRSYQR
ncbi:hypothetical protein ECEPECA14_0454 [Escherichia coli EPECa14]|uniref:Uncharacterized protein n=1 Tax=Escherichia coli TaxID=562 RepID=A0A1D7PSU0_ECOLX|nr:hypothetical protein FORC28_5252 [Escherichia coli]EFZ43706.1 hypothetical protein ECEPECA14_0454 [Escherichia coli EPECa14]EHV88191.1 hypothetical protein ECDEC7B_4772 [Escherichia coli DEC7B]EHW26588.1 hypothetical protein ECDEC8C_0081 [Escherichia coli DEC8C]EHW32017.1 hypothetical protein ECDEC8D_0061 [Escherichia coli DEC8D]EHW70296.1 hypothetical protein ECDEC10A_0081 [Escherichia coli DEC10A]EHW71948.1 hypothetical protein ECDEC10D_5702 [Escherichia coli DEC10D]EHW80047.1 hypotheti